MSLYAAVGISGVPCQRNIPSIAVMSHCATHVIGMWLLAQANVQDRERGRHSEDPSKALQSVVRKHATISWA